MIEWGVRKERRKMKKIEELKGRERKAEEERKRKIGVEIAKEVKRDYARILSKRGIERKFGLGEDGIGECLRIAGYEIGGGDWLVELRESVSYDRDKEILKLQEKWINESARSFEFVLKAGYKEYRNEEEQLSELRVRLVESNEDNVDIG